MTFDLLLLSGQIALLVLAASIFAAIITWLILRQSHTADQLLRSEQQEKITAAEQQTAAIKTHLASTEQQCFAAMEQRDEAELQALERSAESRRLTDQLVTLQLNSVTREEHTQLITQRNALTEQLTAAQEQRTELQTCIDRLTREHIEESRTSHSQLDQLRSELATAKASVENLQLALEKLTEEKITTEQSLRTQLQQLRSERHIPVLPVATPTALIAPHAPIAPKPPTPMAPSPASMVEDDMPAFPMAPSRITLRDSLFRESDISSLPPDQPNLDDAHHMLRRMEQELHEKEQLITTLTQEQHSLENFASDEPAATNKLKAARKRLTDTQHRLDAALEDRDRNLRHVRAVTRSLGLVNDPTLRPDNLMLIKGVKTVLNSQLHAYGIFTYRQIAAWDDDDMHAFSELLSFKQRITRDKWQDQARQLHEARYGERLV